MCLLVRMTDKSIVACHHRIRGLLQVRAAVNLAGAKGVTQGEPLTHRNALNINRKIVKAQSCRLRGISCRRAGLSVCNFVFGLVLIFGYGDDACPGSVETHRLVRNRRLDLDRELLHLLPARLVLVRVVNAFADLERHREQLFEDVIAVNQFFALAVSAHDVRMAARLAERLAFYRRSVFHVNASHTSFFLTGNDRSCGG